MSSSKAKVTSRGHDSINTKYLSRLHPSIASGASAHPRITLVEQEDAIEVYAASPVGEVDKLPEFILPRRTLLCSAIGKGKDKN